MGKSQLNSLGLSLNDPNTNGSTEVIVQNQIWEIEKRNDLLQYRIDGWCVWPIVRFRIIKRLNIKLEKITTTKKEKSTRRIIHLFWGLLDIFRFINASKSDYFVLTSTSARSEATELGYKDVFFDDFLLRNKHFFKIENINNDDLLYKSKAALLKSNATTLFIEIAAFLLGELRPGTKNIYFVAENLFDDLQRELDSGIIDFAEIVKSLKFFYWGKRLYGLILNKIKPKCVLIANPGNYEITAAAKELGIPVVEFQHGFIDRYHPGYSWSNYARNLKEIMPIPDAIFLYGNYFKEELTTLDFWEESLKVVGSLGMDSVREKAIKDKTEKVMILFTSQGIDQEKIIDFLSQFLYLIRDQIEIFLYIKLHPRNEIGSEPYTVAFKSHPNVKVISPNSSLSTLDLIKKSHFHMSISSTTHFEALALATPTIVLPFATSERIHILKDLDHVYFVQTPQDLLEIVLEKINQNVSQLIGNYFYKNHALENIELELEKFIKKHSI
jgi:hypothetical protein